MNADIVAQAIGIFAVTNIDDILVLALFFAQGAGRPGATRAIAVGQYAGFAAILAVSVAGSVAAAFLPRADPPYLGLLPLALGLRSGLLAWRHRTDPEEVRAAAFRRNPRSLEVAAVTFANGGDNIGAYVPVFATAHAAGTTVFVAVFLLLLAGWIAAGRWFATRPTIVSALARWGHIVLPAVLIGIGLTVLVNGGAFGL